MSISIQCRKTKREIEIGYNGFRLLRIKIAELLGEPISSLYKELIDSQIVSISKDKRDTIWEDFNKKTDGLIKEHKVSAKVIRFLLESNCEGRITSNTCKLLLKVIGDYDNSFIYGYAGKENPVRFSDFKAILQECVKYNCDMFWY